MRGILSHSTIGGISLTRLLTFMPPTSLQRIYSKAGANSRGDTENATDEVRNYSVCCKKAGIGLVVALCDVKAQTGLLSLILPNHHRFRCPRNEQRPGVTRGDKHGRDYKHAHKEKVVSKGLSPHRVVTLSLLSVQQISLTN
jgi:hypothetical protein